jgi:hypothetical protein
MAVRLSDLRGGRPLSRGRFISVRGWVDPRAIVQLEALRQLKKRNTMISPGIEPATFQLVFFLLMWIVGLLALRPLLAYCASFGWLIVEKQMECRLAGETEVLGENLPQRHFCPSQNPTWTDPGVNPGRRGGKPATNRLSYGAAQLVA